MADFCLVSRRTLSEYEYRLFKFHFLLGADWKLCCHKLNLDRGSFFHEIYRIQQKLGRTFRELEPHALFPLDEYFNSTPRSTDISKITPFQVQGEESVEATQKLLKFPVKRAA